MERGSLIEKEFHKNSFKSEFDRYSVEWFLYVIYSKHNLYINKDRLLSHLLFDEAWHKKISYAKISGCKDGLDLRYIKMPSSAPPPA